MQINKAVEGHVHLCTVSTGLGDDVVSNLDFALLIADIATVLRANETDYSSQRFVSVCEFSYSMRRSLLFHTLTK